MGDDKSAAKFPSMSVSSPASILDVAPLDDTNRGADILVTAYGTTVARFVSADTNRRRSSTGADR